MFPQVGTDQGVGRMAKKIVVALSTALAIALGIFLLVNALGSGLADPSDRGQFIYALVAGLAGIMMIAGVVITGKSPRTGTVLVVGGAVVAAGWHFWVLFIGAPVALLIVVGAILRTQTSPPRAG